MPWDTTELWSRRGRCDRRPGRAAHDRGWHRRVDRAARVGARRLAGVRVGSNGLVEPVSLDRHRRRRSPLAPMEAEFAGPQWVFGLELVRHRRRTASIVAIARAPAVTSCGTFPSTATPQRIRRARSADRVAPGRRGRTVDLSLTASRMRQRPSSSSNLDTGKRHVLRESFTLSIDPAFLSKPEQIEFPTTNGDTAYALYYPPTNPDFVAPGGRAAATGRRDPRRADIERRWRASRWRRTSSRAVALPCSTWITAAAPATDASTCASCTARGASTTSTTALPPRATSSTVATSIPERMAIRGGSAGGYTALAALTFHDVFAAGASHYGVGDLEALARFTHKFESRYMDQLVAPYPEGNRAVPRAFADLPRRPAERPADRVPGRRRPRRADRPGGADRRRTAPAAHPPRVPAVRRRGPRLPSGREHSARDGS